MKWIFSLFLFVSIGNLKAHQPDLSSTMLIEQEDNTWILQIRAALTAFEYEVAAQFPDKTYTSPKEFQDLVIEHVQKNLTVRFNGQDSMELLKPYVKLGHETNVLFEIKNAPETINSIFVQNSSFGDIKRNQSALVVFKEGFTKEQFVLNNANSHSADLMIKGNKFVSKSKTALGSLHSSGRSLIVIAFLSFAMIIFFWMKSKGRVAQV